MNTDDSVDEYLFTPVSNCLHILLMYFALKNFAQKENSFVVLMLEWSMVVRKKLIVHTETNYIEKWKCYLAANMVDIFIACR